jgi:hypothetical protein
MNRMEWGQYPRCSREQNETTSVAPNDPGRASRLEKKVTKCELACVTSQNGRATTRAKKQKKSQKI